jgi:hypothetical protein
MGCTDASRRQLQESSYGDSLFYGSSGKSVSLGKVSRWEYYTLDS